MKRSVSIVATLLILSGSTSLNGKEIALKTGWNLIGIDHYYINGSNKIPLNKIANNNEIKYIFGQTIDGVKTYNPANPLNKGEIATEGLEVGYGYWIEVDKNVSIDIPYNDKIIESIPLKAGWNLIAIASNKQLDSFKNEHTDVKIEYIFGQTIDGVKTYNPDNPLNKGEIAAEGLEAGYGYWVKVLKQVDVEDIGDTDKKLIVYTDKEYNADNLKEVAITVAGKTVNVKVPKDATKAELRIVDEYENEIAGGIVLNSDDIANGSYTVPNDKVSNLDAITNIAYYVMSANPAGVPQPLSNVNIKDVDGNIIATTDANGIASVPIDKVNKGDELIFEKDGYSINNIEFNPDKAVQYIILSPTIAVNADELNDRVVGNNRLAKTLFRPYPIKTVDNKNIGVVVGQGFISNRNLGKISFEFSDMSPVSFFGKDKLDEICKPFEQNNTEYEPQIITGVQALVKINGKVAKGDKVKFSNIDNNDDATFTYYLANFYADTDYILTQKQKNGAILKFYAYDGEKWHKLDNGFDVKRVSEISNGAVKSLFTNYLQFNLNQLIAKVSLTEGVESVVGVLWTKTNMLKNFENIKVKVTEEDGTPIKNAMVNVLGQQIVTDESGIATFNEIKVPRELNNITFEITEPKHYRNLIRVRIGDMTNNKTLNVKLKRPPSTGTINVTTVDNEANAVAKSVVDIITPAVLADVSYNNNGDITVGLEGGAEYKWYIKPNIDKNSPRRTYKTLGRTLSKLNPNGWTKIEEGVEKNSININKILQKLIEEDDLGIGSLQLAVSVKHKNGIVDGNDTEPVVIGQADIMFNKKILGEYGLEVPDNVDAAKIIEGKDVINDDDIGITGKANAQNPYVGVNIINGAKNVKIDWNVMLVYESKNGTDRYYWDGSKWVYDQNLSNAGFNKTYVEDVYDVYKNHNLNFKIEGDYDYLSFNELSNFLSEGNVIKALFIKQSDVDNNETEQNVVDINNNEKSVLNGKISILVIPKVSYTFNDKNVSYIAVAECQFGNISVGKVLSAADLALQPGSLIPHHIYAKTSDDGMLRIANVPLEFGNRYGDQSYLDIMAKKAGYLDSERKTVPGFEMDNPETPELEDVANVNLTLDKRETGKLKIIVKDAQGKVVSGAKILVPSSILKDDKIESLIVVDNQNNDINESEGVIEAENVFEGGYNVTVLKDGYKPATVSVIINKDKEAVANVTIEKIAKNITLEYPYVDSLEMKAEKGTLKVSGKVLDAVDADGSLVYSKAAKASLILNGKVIDIDIDDDGKFKKLVNLDRGVNKAMLYVTNVVGSFKTAVKQFIYIGKTAYLHGYVFDQDGKALSNAIIEIDTSDNDTIYKVTDSNGQYQVNNMPVGEGVINAVWIDENGNIYTVNKKYSIDKNVKDMELNLTIKTKKAAINEPAEIYIDRYNGQEQVPDVVSKDYLELVGRVTSFDKDNGIISFSVFYDDGTDDVIQVQNNELVMINKETNTYLYKIKIPLKEGMNYISATAQNPLYGGEYIDFVVQKKKNNEHANVVKPFIYITSLSGLPVNATVNIRTLNNDPVDLLHTQEINGTSYVQPSLKPDKYYIFNITAVGYEEINQIKYVGSDTTQLYFTMKAIDDFNNAQEQNHKPVAELYWNQYGKIFEFNVDAFDEDGDELKYGWNVDGHDINWNQPYFDTNLSVGEHNVTVTVSDGKSDVNLSASINVEETENHKPQFVGLKTEYDLMVGEDFSLYLSATDQDNDFLVYSAENLPKGLHIDEVSGQIYGTPVEAGEYTVTLTVSDGNSQTKAEIKINVTGNDIQTPPTPDVNNVPTPPKV